ncbi:type II toxin-antitoxin system PemK/MazF family toxin [Reichenbachiella carrageenanivorans]|uniref:mRNA interferase n=1 Tax=Reichenbachiella carrageenanivorans TaxID=2979869 RepID=A0ABY6D1M5_9BACT|nr:type II toxin-antitoxin system PemK/MazF family toxin [Reichenbachiella carrageenanivorans]UXX80046.1 type II toxin-antitoxin system PemK/MazF family toxin [Reichenbachiella carrageenanivorans]
MKRFEVWLANLNPQRSAEIGKVRPVLIVQSNLLSDVGHPSTLICPITTNVNADLKILRVALAIGEGGLDRPSDVIIDQLRAVDNKRLITRKGKIATESIKKVKHNINVVLDLDW